MASATFSVRVALITMSAFAVSHCGSSTFGRGDNKKSSQPAPQAQPEAQTQTQGQSQTQTKSDSQNQAKASNDDTSTDEGALRHCLKAWNGQSPFKDADVANARKINASVRVLSEGPAVQDTQATDKPQLILIVAAVTVLSNSSYELQNPNGWYCIKASVNVKSTLNVNLHCTAHLADNKVDVSVLSTGTQAGQVGVNVLADVRVNKVCK